MGAAFDWTGLSFGQSSELGYVLPYRSIAETGVFADGTSAGDADGEPFDLRVDLNGRQHSWSVYATDTMTWKDVWLWHVTVSGRFNHIRLENRDQLTPGGGPGSLDGDHVFSRLNPSAGFTYSPTRSLNLYAGYSEGSRAATSIELGCADPDPARPVGVHGRWHVRRPAVSGCGRASFRSSSRRSSPRVLRAPPSPGLG